MGTSRSPPSARGVYRQTSSLAVPRREIFLVAPHSTQRVLVGQHVRPVRCQSTQNQFKLMPRSVLSFYYPCLRLIRLSFSSRYNSFVAYRALLLTLEPFKYVAR